MERVLVVIVTYNSGRELSRESSRFQRIAQDPEFDLVFVDNNSSDNTVAICSSIPGAMVDCNRHNVGFAAAVNQGLAHSDSHEYFILLNPDVSLGIDGMKEMIRYLDDNPGITACTPVLIDEEGKPEGFWSSGTTLTAMVVADLTLGLYKRVTWLRRKYGWLGVQDITLDASPDFISGACFTARTSALEEIGYFDERFFLYYEEADWCRRAISAGCHLGIFTGVQAVHQMYGSSSTKESARRLYYMSRYTFLRKHYGRSGEYLVRAADLASGSLIWLIGSIFLAVQGKIMKWQLIAGEAVSEGRVRARAAIRKQGSRPTKRVG